MQASAEDVKFLNPMGYDFDLTEKKDNRSNMIKLMLLELYQESNMKKLMQKGINRLILGT